MIIILSVLLGISVIANGFQWYRWHSYRTKSAGIHSHTGMISRVTQDQIERDLKRRKDKG